MMTNHGLDLGVGKDGCAQCGQAKPVTGASFQKAQGDAAVEEDLGAIRWELYFACQVVCSARAISELTK